MTQSTNRSSARRDPAALQQAARTALIVGSDNLLVERLQRIAAATGYQSMIASATALEGWESADVVLLDARCAAVVADTDPARRPHVWLVSDGPVPDEAWRECVALGGQDAVDLDLHEHWLVDQISSATRDPGRGVVVGVTGSCGGTGASTLVAALALAAAAEDESVLIVDTDERGGHLDLLLESVHPGLGWSDLQKLTGRVSGEALQAAITTYGDIPVVTNGRDEPPCAVPFEALRAVVAASASAFRLTVVDIPAFVDITDTASICDEIVVVTTSDARGGLAVRRWRERHEDLAVTVAARTPHRHCLPNDAFLELTSGARSVAWLSEVRRTAERFGRSQAGVQEPDRLVAEAGLLLERLDVLSAGVR